MPAGPACSCHLRAQPVVSAFSRVAGPGRTGGKFDAPPRALPVLQRAISAQCGIGVHALEHQAPPPGGWQPYTPGVLTPNETYAVIAYLLNLNGIVPADAVMNAETLPAVQMPARDRFVVDDRRGGHEVRWWEARRRPSGVGAKPERARTFLSLTAPGGSTAEAGNRRSSHRGSRIRMSPIVWELLLIGVYVNIANAVFNLIPIPPLDGNYVLRGGLSMVRTRWAYNAVTFLDQMVVWGPWLFIGLIMLDNIVPLPRGLIWTILWPFFRLLLWLITGLPA